nr:PREDICTED: taste receptor type 1 member 3 [Lepisosteus oculatus]
MEVMLRMLFLPSVLWTSPTADPLHWLKNISTDLFRSPGDIILGGLFPIHELTSNLSERSQPDDVYCDRLNTYGLSRALVMKFAVDEINNTPDLLPGTRLGFEVYDSCKQASVIMRPTMLFLSEKHSRGIRVLCNYTGYSTRVLAVIGPSTSEMVSITGKLFSFFLMPQISYGATSEKFSDKMLFPSFLRTVPSDKLQAEAMVHLVLEFGWNWIAVVGSEDEYGKQGVLQFSMLAAQQAICIAYEALIPIYSDPREAVDDILNRINQTKAGVVVLFTLTVATKALFSQVIQKKMKAVWIGSTAWALSEDITTIPGIQTVGTLLVFSNKNTQLSHFEIYAQQLFTLLEQERLQANSLDPPTSPSATETEFPLPEPCPDCWNLSQANMTMIREPQLQRTAFSVYSSVYSVAHALHQLLGCSATLCRRKDAEFFSWQVLEVLKKVSFTINNTKVTFDVNGNPSIGYEVLTWRWDRDVLRFQNIGTYEGKLVLNRSLIHWHTENSQVPNSTCSPNCTAGQVRRVKGFHSCCFDCIDCKEGTFQNNTEDFQCTDCPDRQWSTLRSTRCTDPTYHYLKWNQYESLGLILGAVLVLAGQAAVGVLFLRHRGTPLVQASGGPLCGVALLSLTGGCASLSLFLGKPGDAVCRLQQPFNAFFPAVALSIILAISLQVIYVTEFPGVTPSRLDSLRGPGSWMVVLTLCSVQAGLCGWFVQEGRPLSEYVSRMRITFVETFLRCEVEPMVGFGLMYGFNGLLALISFMCTFMAQKPAKQYNLARDITFSTLAYCVVWVVFIPIYTGLGEMNKSLAQMAAILLSNLGLVAAYFFPKCHLLLTHPELNTVDYFRTYLEGAPPPQDGQEQ